MNQLFSLATAVPFKFNHFLKTHVRKEYLNAFSFFAFLKYFMQFNYFFLIIRIWFFTFINNIFLLIYLTSYFKRQYWIFISLIMDIFMTLLLTFFLKSFIWWIDIYSSMNRNWIDIWTRKLFILNLSIKVI